MQFLTKRLALEDQQVGVSRADTNLLVRLFLEKARALTGIAPYQRSYDMELAPRCLLHCCNPGTCGVHTSMVFALLPTRTPMERFCAASSHLPRPTFSGPAITSKVLSRCLPFSGELKACLGMQAEVQDPFPGV